MKKFERFNSEQQALNHLEDILSQGVNQEDVTIVSKYRLIDISSSYPNVTFRDAEGGIIDKIAALFSEEEVEDKVLKSIDLTDVEREECRQAIDQEEVIVFNAYHDFKGALDGEHYDMSKDENVDGVVDPDKRAATLAGAQFGSHDAGREPLFNKDKDTLEDEPVGPPLDKESLDDDEGARENAFNDDKSHDLNDDAYLKERKDDEEFDTQRVEEGMDTDNERNKNYAFGKDNPYDGVSELDKDKIDNHNNADSFTDDNHLNNESNMSASDSVESNGTPRFDDTVAYNRISGNYDKLGSNVKESGFSDPEPEDDYVRNDVHHKALHDENLENKSVASGRENLDPDYRDEKVHNDLMHETEKSERDILIERSEGTVERRTVSADRSGNDNVNNWEQMGEDPVNEVENYEDFDDSPTVGSREDSRKLDEERIKEKAPGKPLEQDGSYDQFYDEENSLDEKEASEAALDQAGDLDFDDKVNSEKRSNRLDDTLRADDAREDAFDHDKGRF